MLRTLAIRNYALISELEIDFPSGFSVITGETGAGKSIILGALSLLLGQRAETRFIRQGADKCIIEGVFDISAYALKDFFEEKDLEFDPETCVIRREIWNTGKSRAFVNDSPAGLTDLKDLGNFLIDIHSQHQNLLLKDNRFQLNVLDTLADNNALLGKYGEAYHHYLDTGAALRKLQNKAKSDAEEEDYLRFRLNELHEAKLKPGEQEELEKELQTLSHIEEIKSELYRIETNLSDDNTGINVKLKDTLNAAQALGKVFYRNAETLFGRLESTYIELKDILSEVAADQEKMEFDPERLIMISERLDWIYTLQKKHKRHSIEALIELQHHLEEQLALIDNYDEELKKLQDKLKQAADELKKQAAELTRSRKEAAKVLRKELTEIVSVLGMPNMRFDTLFDRKETFDASGADEVEFVFSAAKGSEMQPVARIASGGEIARLMLGIKALIAGVKTLPTIIFDEVDTGISGEVADKMGSIMQAMGNQMQVIAITHLPQIAVKGGTHFFAYKTEKDELTETSLRRLSDEERINEVALLLSGAELTAAAIANAKELLRFKI